VIHIDFLGRKTPSRGKNQYALIARDDYSGMTHALLSPSRDMSSVVHLLEQLRIEIGHHHVLPPLTLMGDNEFDTKEVHAWASANNARVIPTAAREHHYNGKNRTRKSDSLAGCDYDVERDSAGSLLLELRSSLCGVYHATNSNER
jgi:hypothetical protein